MARYARCSRLLAVLLVAGETTEAFVDTDGCTVVARSDLAAGLRCVALVAEGLALVGAYFDGARAITHLREGQTRKRNVVLLATVKQCQRRPANFFTGAGVLHLNRRAREGHSVTVHLMAGEAWDGGLHCQLRNEKPPRTLRVHRSDQIADAAVEVHGVTTEAVVHQTAALVVIFVQKDMRVRGAVRTRGPVGEFLAVALGATRTDFEHVICLQPNLLRNLASQMSCQLTNVLQMEAGVESEDIPVTFGTRHIAMS